MARTISVRAGEKLVVNPGDTVRVTMTVGYRGPAIDGEVRAAIGVKGVWFNEVFYSEGPVHFGESVDFITYEIISDIPISDNPGEDYDMYAKIMGVPGPDIYTDYYLDIIDVVSLAPPAEFANFTIDGYAKA